MFLRISISLLLFFLTNGVSFAQQDPVLLEINGKKVTKSEFLQIYLKNNPNPRFDSQTINEYLDLFKKFQLKVIEAEHKGYDTIPRLVKELEGYKKNLSTPYLTDSAKNQELVKEAYDRLALEVNVSHILIRVDQQASPIDTLKAYNRIMEIRNRILKGEKFEDVAKITSDDPSAHVNGGGLGYFTAFQMVYSFEDAAYKTAVGSISMPVRTRFGYHLIKVNATRPSRGSIKTAHIMIAVAKSASKEDDASAKKKIEEIYELLKKGESFEELVKKFSDDPGSNSKGGVLPTFGAGTSTRMVPEFEDAAFALQKDGEFSLPVRTEYGYHIIKRIEHKELPSFDQMKKEIQTKVNRDERSLKTQDSFISKTKIAYHYKKKSEKRLEPFIRSIDSSYYDGKWTAQSIHSNKTLFLIDGKKYKQKDLAKYMEINHRMIKKTDVDVLVSNQYTAWENYEVLKMVESKLPTKYPEYKALLNEYHDGIILYEIMQDEVWNKASKDTTGLKTFFEVNRGKYVWGERYDALVYECVNKAIADKVYKMIQNDTINSKHVLEVINKDSELNLKVKTNKYEVKNTSYLKDKPLVKGVNVPYEFEGKIYVIKIAEIIPQMNKELAEARGLVTSDYQNYLEKKWLEDLAKKYPIVVHQDVLNTIIK